MNSIRIHNKIIQLIEKVCEIKIDESFELLNIDSLQFVRILLEIEDEFNIIFSEDDLLLENFKRIEDLTNKVILGRMEKK